MKSTLTLLAFLLVAVSAQAVTHATQWQEVVADHSELASLKASSANLNMDAFLDMTPKKFRELTGEKLGIKGSLALKAAQKKLKKMQKQQASGSSATDIPKGLYIVLVIFGWGWLGMGLMDDWEGNNWWVNLILSWVLCWLPGVIHGFVKMSDYY